MPSSADDVLAEIVANPDDDGPRLVWADLVGGERGELVVVQCDLARGGLTRAETAARRAREAELLDAHSTEWAGTVPKFARRWCYRRGFVEVAEIHASQFDAQALRAAPTVASIVIDSYSDSGPVADARGLHVPHGPASWLRPMPRLTAFGFDHARPECIPVIRRMIEGAPIERLRFRHHSLNAVQLGGLLDAAPNLRALEVLATEGYDVPLEILSRFRLSHLHVGVTHSMAALAHSTVEHFGFIALGELRLSGLERIRTLSVGGNCDDVGRALLDAKVPALRALRWFGDVSAETLRAIDERFGDQLVDVIVTKHDDLLHPSPSAMFQLDRPRFAVSQHACFVRLDNRGEIFDVPPHFVEEQIVLGRGAHASVRLRSGTVARHHARLFWRDGHHEIEDMGSTNGIVRGTRKIDREILFDGDELILGEVIVRYFVGAGARERAEAALARRR